MRKRYLFYGEVTAQTALHIGSGRGDLRTDATVVKELRDGSEEPFIPGSSFKGVLRSAVETLTVGLPSVQTCQLTAGRSKCLSVDRERQEQVRAAQERQESENILDKMILDRLCHTCRLFGSPFRAAKVFVRDLPLNKEKKTELLSEIRHGVGIDRDTATAREGVKFDYEAVPSQNIFDCELIVESPDELDLPLLAVGLREMQLGQITLGGNTSRGVGRIQLKLSRIVRVDLSGKALIDYLRNSQPAALKGAQEWIGESQINEFLNEQIGQLLARRT